MKYSSSDFEKFRLETEDRKRRKASDPINEKLPRLFSVSAEGPFAPHRLVADLNEQPDQIQMWKEATRIARCRCQSDSVTPVNTKRVKHVWV